VLLIFSGLPGAGKTTLARWLARDLRAVHLRIDTIEHAHLTVIADSVNPDAITRDAWRAVARRANVGRARGGGMRYAARLHEPARTANALRVHGPLRNSARLHAVLGRELRDRGRRVLRLAMD
jgi:hypothetical protein